MQRRSHRQRGYASTVAVVALVALGLAPAALGDDRAASSEPSAIERLIRQEDARRIDLATDDATTMQNDLATMLDARERAMVMRPDAVSALDPAIRTAMVAHASAAATTGPDVPQATSGADAFAWGAAALGLAAGVAAMCVLLGCVTLVRSHGRLRSV